MADRYRLTSVETVLEEGSWLFTVRDERGEDQEVILVPCEADGETSDGGTGDGEAGDGSATGVAEGGATVGVEAWVNRCTHEAQRLYREGVGAIVRDGEIVCPKHGSLFDACSGYCDNGEAAETTLVSVAIAVEDGQVYLTDDDVTYLYEGASSDDEDDGPSSTSHLQF